MLHDVAVRPLVMTMANCRFPILPKVLGYSYLLWAAMLVHIRLFFIYHCRYCAAVIFGFCGLFDSGKEVWSICQGVLLPCGSDRFSHSSRSSDSDMCVQRNAYFSIFSFPRGSGTHPQGSGIESRFRNTEWRIFGLLRTEISPKE